MTTKLYWSDSHLLEFDAEVIEVRQTPGGASSVQVLILDRTAFYPLGGGQPADLGTINGVAVLDVQIEENGTILHHVASNAGTTPGARVSGVIDGARRRDLTRQHTGQHVLSQAFFQLFGAETRGFRLNDDIAEIDLALDSPSESVPSAIEAAESLANSVIFDNREIRTHLLTPEQAARLPLRKETFVSDCVRVVEIDGFDWSPCGGTHAQHTGEIGLIAIRGWERAKRMVRIEFICGDRALREFRLANNIVTNLARRFTVGRHEIEDSVARLVEEQKSTAKRVRELAEIASRSEANELLETATAVGTEVGGVRVVRKVFDGRGIDELKLVAHRLVERPGVIALLGTREGEMARLVFARSADVPADMSALMRKACEMLGGRGGGKPDFAQGGGPSISQLDDAIRSALY